MLYSMSREANKHVSTQTWERLCDPRMKTDEKEFQKTTCNLGIQFILYILVYIFRLPHTSERETHLVQLHLEGLR